MKYKSYDLIITTDNIKKEILKKISLEKEIFTTKIMTKRELDLLLVGEVKKEGIEHVISKYDVTYSLAKVYLKNVLYKPEKLKEVYLSLEENNLIVKNKLFKNIYINILVINVHLDKYIEDFFKDSVITNLEYDYNYVHNIYEFNTLEEEVYFVGTNIIDLLNDSRNASEIKIVNAQADYTLALRKIFHQLNIPIDIKDSVSILKTTTFINFYNKLKESKDIEVSLESINKDKIYDKLINYFNANSYNEINEFTLKMIYDDLKNIKLAEEKMHGAIEIINLEDVMYDNKYYFILGINEGSVPKSIKDEDFISDKEKEKLGILTSLEKNNYSELLFDKIYKNVPNLTLSYKKNSAFAKFEPSYLISEMNINVIKNEETSYNYSKKYNEIALAKKLDDLVKFNVLSDETHLLFSNYEIDYKSYNNQFTGISKEKYNDYINEITLSYTSINDYYNCGFKYYIKKVLKLEKNEETLALLIGNLFHDVLSKIYTENFDLEKEYDEYLIDKIVSAKDKVFLKTLKEELKFIIEVILDFENVTTLKENLCEEKVIIEDIIPGKVKLYGVIDKLKFNKDRSLAVIIDYKTGSISSNIDNVCYGLNLQLPIYITLAKSFDKDIKIGGFYLQKILNNPKIDEDVEERKKSLKLEGYSIDNENLLKELDSGYANSQFIKSMKLSSNGFSNYAKVLSEKSIDKLEKITKEQIKNAAAKILDGSFLINPKKIDGKNVSCNYCKFKDLCYMKEEDVVELENKKIKDILSEEDIDA